MLVWTPITPDNKHVSLPRDYARTAWKLRKKNRIAANAVLQTGIAIRNRTWPLKEIL